MGFVYSTCQCTTTCSACLASQAAHHKLIQGWVDEYKWWESVLGRRCTRWLYGHK